MRAYATICCILLSACLVRAQSNLPGREQRCGPPEYCARTDLRLEPATTPPPALGPAGSIIKDPTFGSRILRVTEADTLKSVRPNATFSFASSASAAQNTWNVNSTRFFVTTSGGFLVTYTFEPISMKARLDEDLPPRWGPGAEFSRVDPDVMYGWTSGSHLKMQEYDFSSKRARDVFDPADCVKFESNWFGIDVSLSAGDRRLMGVFGPQQDKDPYVYVYDRKQGCRWLNTLTGEVGGQWGPKGAISFGDRFTIHNARISLSGDYAVIVGDRQGLVVWRIATLDVALCGLGNHCGGHWVLGYSHLINQAGWLDDMNMLVHPLDNLTATKPLIDPLPTPPEWGFDGHWSWNNDGPDDSAPVCGSTYANRAAPNEVVRAWENEVICIRADGKKSTVWRFAHTFTTARNGFWSTPRGNISQDGRFLMFTSDWDNKLGASANGAGNRTDVFIVELK